MRSYPPSRLSRAYLEETCWVQGREQAPFDEDQMPRRSAAGFVPSDLSARVNLSQGNVSGARKRGADSCVREDANA